MSGLELHNLQFSYPGSASAGYRFDVDVSPGEILAVTGKSGSGKSTLLDLIAGFLMPSEGSILLDGKDIIALPPSDRQVSILFQNNNLFEHLSVLENVCLALNPNTRATMSQKITAAAMLANIGLEGFENRRTASLSGGQKQRTALARELLRESKLILLDEPFNGLDKAAQDKILPLLANAAKSAGRAIILVTHDPSSVADIVDKTGSVADGKFIPD